MYPKISNSFNQLINFCESEQYKGHDPFDGLNSVFFNYIPFLKHNHLFRLCWIQFFKRFPINLRYIFGVKKQYNSKALGLFLSGYCNLYTISRSDYNLSKINFFIDKIIENITIG